LTVSRFPRCFVLKQSSFLVLLLSDVILPSSVLMFSNSFLSPRWSGCQQRSSAILVRYDDDDDDIRYSLTLYEGIYVCMCESLLVLYACLYILMLFRHKYKYELRKINGKQYLTVFDYDFMLVKSVYFSFVCSMTGCIGPCLQLLATYGGLTYSSCSVLVVLDDHSHSQYS